MSSSDAYAELVADLLKWLGQHETPAGAWYLDEGQPAALAMPPSGPAESEPQTTEDPFAAEFEVFVTKAMALIVQHGSGESPVQSESVADPEAALTALQQEVTPCAACDLHQSRQHVVFGAGSPRADLVIVGEAPGHDEDLQGMPFVGRSGQLLTKILAAIGLDRQDVFICNILKCRPPNNRDPLPTEVLACEPHLQRQLSIIRPRLICCLGRVAAQTLLRKQTSLGKMRGGVHFYGEIPVLVTYHPAYLLRNPAAKRDTWQDIRQLRALLDVLVAQKIQRGSGHAGE